MVTSEAYFDNIKDELIKELSRSKSSIYAAIAWFTDKDLYQCLTAKSVNGIKVELLVVDDEINRGSSLFYRFGKEFPVIFISDRLMHNKFCVIDERIVITGSYNWTYKASSQNDENIIITYGDNELASQYISEFNRLSGKEPSGYTAQNINKILKRLKIIQQMIELEEVEDLAVQTSKLQNEKAINDLTDVIDLIEEKKWSSAILKIQQITQRFSQLTVYEDPLIIALRLELKSLEYEIIAVESKVDDAERLISTYNSKLHNLLGDLISKILEFKRDYFSSHRQESHYSQSEYEKAKRDYERFANEHEEIESRKYYDLSGDQIQDLKKLYKQAVIKCHPDKNPGKEKEAHEVFVKLQDAFNRQDIDGIMEIIEIVNSGWLFVSISEISDIEMLKKKIKKLRHKLINLNHILIDIEKSEEFKIMKNSTVIESHFEEKRKQLENELQFWQNLIKDEINVSSSTHN